MKKMASVAVGILLLLCLAVGLTPVKGCGHLIQFHPGGENTPVPGDWCPYGNVMVGYPGNPFTGMPSAMGYVTAYYCDWRYYNCWFPGHPHYGLDFGLATGTPIFATADGTVVATGGGCSVGDRNCNGGMGNYVVVRAQDWTAIYMHLQDIHVSAGQQVNYGDIIGTGGNTGYSTGAHLHYEIRDPGWQAVDPYCTIFDCPYSEPPQVCD